MRKIIEGHEDLEAILKRLEDPLPLFKTIHDQKGLTEEENEDDIEIKMQKERVMTHMRKESN